MLEELFFSQLSKRFTIQTIFIIFRVILSSNGSLKIKELILISLIFDEFRGLNHLVLHMINRASIKIVSDFLHNHIKIEILEHLAIALIWQFMLSKILFLIDKLLVNVS